MNLTGILHILEISFIFFWYFAWVQWCFIYLKKNEKPGYIYSASAKEIKGKENVKKKSSRGTAIKIIKIIK